MSRFSLKTGLLALAVVALSLSLLWGASEAEAAQRLRLSITLQHLGSFMLASVAIALIFQLWQVRGLVEDMWEEAEIVKSLRSARLSRFTLDFQEAEVPWARLFRESDHVTILFLWGISWRGWHLTQLREFLQDEKAHLKVILPDAEKENLMQALALRFLDADEIKRNIENAVQEFTQLGNQGKGKVTLFAFRVTFVSVKSNPPFTSCTWTRIVPAPSTPKLAVSITFTSNAPPAPLSPSLAKPPALTVMGPLVITPLDWPASGFATTPTVMFGSKLAAPD